MIGIGKFVQRFLADESAVSSVEYALLLTFVAAGIIIGIESLSSAVQGNMEAAADCIDGTVDASAC